jgi:hypothetical protein
VGDSVTAELDGGVLHDGVAEGVTHCVAFAFELEGGGCFGGARKLYNYVSLRLGLGFCIKMEG